MLLVTLNNNRKHEKKLGTERYQRIIGTGSSSRKSKPKHRLYETESLIENKN